MMPYSNEWCAQQSLFMGSSTPVYQRQVSLSPQESTMVAPLGPYVSSFHPQSIDTLTPSSGRVLYPLPVYHYGNPGFYYDPLQFPVSSETQTTPRLSLHNTSNDPFHPYVPHPLTPHVQG
jgi:hypothetical protein